MAWEGIEKPIISAPRMRRGERVRYVPNHRSFGAFMRSEQMRDVTAEVAGDISLLASAAVPESSPGPRGGKRDRGLHSKVKHGFRVKRNSGLVKVGGNLRVRVDVVNNVDGSALLEFGARGLTRLRMLGRAGSSIGDFKPEDGPS